MKKQSYDLIGDIHGQAPELVKLLEKLSYKEIDGIWQHTERKVIFLGDFVDRGDYQKEVIDIVRPMVESGYALSVMGNHEYNAIAYYTQNKQGEYLRSHNKQHTDQHKKFLDTYADDLAEKEDVVEWFKTLPLWLDLEGLRVVHACWDFNLVSKIEEPVLTDNLLQQSSIKGIWQYDAIETLLKGREIPLPKGKQFPDKDGHPRKHIRTRWWDSKAKTYKQVFFGSDDALTHIPDDPVTGDHLIDYAKDDKPVFLGHYWMKGDIQPLAENIACLDYSVADAKDPNARLVAYRWDGEQKIDVRKFIFVTRN